MVKPVSGDERSSYYSAKSSKPVRDPSEIFMEIADLLEGKLKSYDYFTTDRILVATILRYPLI
jgi:hypothetical protein